MDRLAADRAFTRHWGMADWEVMQWGVSTGWIDWALVVASRTLQEMARTMKGLDWQIFTNYGDGAGTVNEQNVELEQRRDMAQTPWPPAASLSQTYRCNGMLTLPQIIYLRATGGEVGASSALAPKIGPLGLVSQPTQTRVRSVPNTS